MVAPGKTSVCECTIVYFVSYRSVACPPQFALYFLTLSALLTAASLPSGWSLLAPPPGLTAFKVDVVSSSILGLGNDTSAPPFDGDNGARLIGFPALGDMPLRTSTLCGRALSNGLELSGLASECWLFVCWGER